MVILFAAACSQTDKKTGESKEEAISQAITDAGYEVVGTEL